MSKVQAAAFHGTDALKYSKRGKTPGTVVSMPYIKGVSISKETSKSPQYANNRMVLEIYNETGMTGTINTTARDEGFEEAAGMCMPLATGMGVIRQKTVSRFDIYHEFILSYEDGSQEVVKSWMLNVGVYAPEAIEHTTHSDSIDFGEYAYPITVYGDKVMDAEGTAEYIDASGMRHVCYEILCYPEDDGYSEFEKTVPVPKVKTE